LKQTNYHNPSQLIMIISQIYWIRRTSVSFKPQGPPHIKKHYNNIIRILPFLLITNQQATPGFSPCTLRSLRVVSLPNSQCTKASTSTDLSHLLKHAYKHTHRNAGLSPTACGVRRRARLSGLLRPPAHSSPSGEGLSFDSPGRAQPAQSPGPSQARPILERRGERRCRLLRPRLLRSLLCWVRLVNLPFIRGF
jgi:hypothetical protein